MFRLDGKHCLVTGGASGIGEATSWAFARSGATVYVTDRDEANARRVADAIAAGGFVAEPIVMDVTDETGIGRVAARIHADRGCLHVLVNNAGIGHVGTMTSTTGSDLDRLFAVNVRGVFNVTKAFLPAMIEARAGAIVNLSSIGGVIGIRDRLAYCTTKFAVVGLTKAMALDHAAAGIRVNCICPGRVETPFVKARLREYPDPEAAYREMASTQANGRMATADEIAAAALYLASDESAFITGSALIIDGGWSAGK